MHDCTQAQQLRAGSLAPYPQHISAKAWNTWSRCPDRLADLGKKIRAAILVSDELGDADTADLYTGVSRDADKYR